MSLLQSLWLDSVYCTCSCSSSQLSLFVFAVLPSHSHVIQWLGGLTRWRWSSRPIDGNDRQGMNRTSLYTANQCTAHLNLCFSSSILWSVFCLMKLLRKIWLVHTDAMWTSLQQISSYSSDSELIEHLRFFLTTIVWMDFRVTNVWEFSLKLSV